MPTDQQATLFDPNALEDDSFEDDTLNEENIPTDDPLKPFLDKYKDQTGIAKALLAKDQHIKRLEKENAGMRTDLATSVKVQEAVDKLLSSQSRTNTNGANSSAANNGADNGTDTGNSSSNQPKALTAEDVRSLLDEERKAMVAAENVRKTKALLEANLGSNWGQKLLEKAKSIGESPEFFEALSKRNPNAVLAYFNTSTEQNKGTTPSLFNTGVNTTAQTLKQTGTNSGTKNFAFYEKLRAENPALYWSPKMQLEIHNAALQQKEAFYS